MEDNREEIQDNGEEKKNINIKISNKVINEIIDMCNYEEFGARKIDKIIKSNIENIIIDNILEKKYNIYIKSINKESMKV